MVDKLKSISIVVTVFNEEKRLKKNLITINNFTKNKKIEVIFVNDGSSDSSEKIIKKFIKNNKKIKIIYL
jgi:glycosyltransferase involved in cell wall biosynthesis